jgi:beta-mannosidase
MIASCEIESGRESISLLADWECAVTEIPRSPENLDDLRFAPASVPGTTGADTSEYWFRCHFDFDTDTGAARERIYLDFGGLATLSEVWLNGRSILQSNSMFARHRIEVTAFLHRRNELLLVCRALAPQLRAKRLQQPRARWRTRVVTEQQLRWFRTTLLGRAPGFAPGPPVVGPWRPVCLVRERGPAIDEWTRVIDPEGAIHASIRFRTPPAAAWLVSGENRAELTNGEATLGIPGASRWWPHTHGEPALYPVRLELQLHGGAVLTYDDIPAAFRTVSFDRGFRLNGVPVFTRGVIWTPLPDSTEENLRRRLTLLRDGGFNLIRLAGTGWYEDETFHRLCDELGLLVWQDLMFANMDYPFADADFLETVRAEAATELTRVSRHASTAMICGNSEIEQQVGMLGLDPALGRGVFFGEDLPRIAARCCPDTPYIPSAPFGGDQPFRTRQGVANYFGVGAYLRPLEDARRAGVPYASECLAFSNIPEPEAIEAMALATPGGITPTHPAWKRGVPRDGGASWDFEDVRDHYLKLLYSVDPAELRYADPRFYWDLSRLVSGEAMAEVFGEWRRAGSGCGGGIVLAGADLHPGAGWGIIDSRGVPKAAWWLLRRALAPRAIWMTDEGLNGYDIHVANDTPAPVRATLRIRMFASERKTDEADREIVLDARATAVYSFEEILGRFVDISRAYRFGPPAHDLITASLHRTPGESAFARCFRFPAGRDLRRRPIVEIGITAQAAALATGEIEVLVGTRAFAHAVRVTAPGLLPDDCYFSIEPGGTHRLLFSPTAPAPLPSGLSVTALNAEGRITIPVEKPA